MSIFSWFSLKSDSTATLEDAVKILGANNVVTVTKAGVVWGRDVPKLNPLRRNKSDFVYCEKQNKSGKAKWKLVYLFGLSLTEQCVLAEQPDSAIRPKFFSVGLWNGSRNYLAAATFGGPQSRLRLSDVFVSDESPWMDKKFVPGYYLINFKLYFRNLEWVRQARMVNKLGSRYERIPEALLAEGLQTVFGVHGERLLEEEVHYGSIEDSTGSRLRVGYFDRSGLKIFSYPLDMPRKDTGVIVHLKAEERSGKDRS